MVGNQTKLLQQQLGTTIELSNNTSASNQTISTGNITAEALPRPPPGKYYAPVVDTIARGYFGLGDWEQVVHVTSDSDFLTCIWARNVPWSISIT